MEFLIHRNKLLMVQVYPKQKLNFNKTKKEIIKEFNLNSNKFTIELILNLLKMQHWVINNRRLIVVYEVDMLF